MESGVTVVERIQFDGPFIAANALFSHALQVEGVEAFLVSSGPEGRLLQKYTPGFEQLLSAKLPDLSLPLFSFLFVAIQFSA